MKQIFFAAAILAGVMAISSCTRTPLERAVKRELLPSEANVVVANHCQGCHVHVKFRPELHMAQMKNKFPVKSPFREAKECLECHDLRLKGLIKAERRATTRPHGRLLTMKDIPKPRKAVRLKRSSKKAKGEVKGKTKADKKKERKWYFLYLF